MPYGHYNHGNPNYDDDSFSDSDHTNYDDDSFSDMNYSDGGVRDGCRFLPPKSTEAMDDVIITFKQGFLLQRVLVF